MKGALRQALVAGFAGRFYGGIHLNLTTFIRTDQLNRILKPRG
jgi:hypothetical protein